MFIFIRMEEIKRDSDQAVQNPEGTEEKGMPSEYSGEKPRMGSGGQVLMWLKLVWRSFYKSISFS